MCQICIKFWMTWTNVFDWLKFVSKCTNMPKFFIKRNTMKEAIKLIHYFAISHTQQFCFKRIVNIVPMFHIGLDARKPVFSCSQNNKGPDLSDQRLCYSFLESITSRLAMRDISIFQLVSVAEQAGLSLTLLETPKGVFRRHDLVVLT